MQQSILTTYIETQLKHEAVELIKSADLLCQHRFLFDDNWDMEPCPIAYHLVPLNWKSDCHGDEEWLFMLNRQEYLWKLGMAFQITGQVSYLEQIREFIASWIDQLTRLDSKDPRCRTIDTAIRCISWTRVIPLLRKTGVLSELEYTIFLQFIKQQLSFLVAQYRMKDTLSNWGIFQTVAILLVESQFGEDIDLEAEHRFATEEILLQLQTQILEDGTQFEQSFLYHVEVFQLLLELTDRIPAYASTLSGILRKMGEYVRWMTGVDGKSIAVGDSDIHALHDVLQFAAIVLGDPSYLLEIPKINILDLKILFLVGPDGLKRFKAMNTSPLPQGGRHFSESGHSLIREGETILFFKSGPMGSGHSHSDQNQICLYFKGKPIFIDPGRYTYRECPERYFLKSSLAHSTCILDQMSAEQVRDSWTYEDYPRMVSHHYKGESGIHWLQGVYQAKAANGLPFWHQRQILTVGSDLIFILDILDCPGHHTLETQFILSPDMMCSQGRIGDLRIYSDEDFVLKSSLHSPRYNQLETTHKIVRKNSFRDHLATITVFADREFIVESIPVLKSNQEPQLTAKTFSCKRDKAEDYLILFQDGEIYQGEKLSIVDGRKLRGKCLVYDKHSEKLCRLLN